MEVLQRKNTRVLLYILLELVMVVNGTVDVEKEILVENIISLLEVRAMIPNNDWSAKKNEESKLDSKSAKRYGGKHILPSNKRQILRSDTNDAIDLIQGRGVISTTGHQQDWNVGSSEVGWANGRQGMEEAGLNPEGLDSPLTDKTHVCFHISLEIYFLNFDFFFCYSIPYLMNFEIDIFF